MVIICVKHIVYCVALVTSNNFKFSGNPKPNLKLTFYYNATNKVPEI